MSERPSPTDEDRELIEPLCDHCGKPEYKHVQIVGAGKVCPANCFTFSTAKSARIESLLSDRAKLEEANDRLAKWLYEACGGFPVSEEAFAALAPDLPIIAREMSKPFEGRSLAEFRAEIEQKLAALNRSTDRAA